MANTAHHGERAHDDVLALDAWLQRPDVRLTRALKPREWSTATDLFGALDLKHSEWGAYQVVLARLVLTGHVRRGDGEVTRYLLVRDLAPPGPASKRPPDHPGIEGEERQGWFFWRGTWRRS